MQFKGKIIEVLPVVTGQSGQYPKSIVFDVFGSDKLQEYKISVGEELICDIDFKVIKGKNGNTFNNITCWRVTRESQNIQQ